MRNLLIYLFTLYFSSCNNEKPSHPSTNENLSKTDALGYSQEDLVFIRSADSICRTIDTEGVFERLKDDSIVDRDGQIYTSHYKGYAKSSSDSVIKILATIVFSQKDSGTTTIYYYNGTIIKGITEIFRDDTVNVAFYYDENKTIYPKEEGMEEAAENLRRRSISWRTHFTSLQ